MLIHKGYKFRLLPNFVQKTFLNKSFGCSRMIYNYFLNEKIVLYKNTKKSIMDSGWGEFRRMVDYKGSWYGREINYVPTFYPSSKTCSNCGNKLINLSLSTRKWECPECHIAHDRDVNASMNIRNYGRVGTTRRVCGDMKQPAFLLTNI
jgi:putative transposase